MKADGSPKNNSNNYWDGSSASVKVENQTAVTNGSDYAMMVSFDPTLITDEQAELTNVSYGANWSDNRSMWVGYTISVGEDKDLTGYELTIDMKMVNMSTKITAYAVSNYEGTGDYAFEHSTELSFTGVALEDGWYRYVITFDAESNATTEAEYVVLSLDNTATGLDKTQPSVAKHFINQS